MSREYDNYLKEHIGGMAEAYFWLENHVPDAVPKSVRDISYEFTFDHDESKFEAEEYHPYDAYFYGDKSYKVVQEFDYAWLHHIHHNPHHWQYWVLINDDEKDGTRALKMPDRYVIEMICDWWSFSFRKGDLYEIFTWYDAHKDRMILHKETREQVEYILSEIRKELDAEKERNEMVIGEAKEETE